MKNWRLSGKAIAIVWKNPMVIKKTATFSNCLSWDRKLDLINLATNRAEKVSNTSRESKWKT